MFAIAICFVLFLCLPTLYVNSATEINGTQLLAMLQSQTQLLNMNEAQLSLVSQEQDFCGTTWLYIYIHMHAVNIILVVTCVP